ncbi:MAG: TIGR00153 family protein [Candidatus Adiutricales bacterium]
MMRIPFFSLFIYSPFDELLEHAEKVKECAWVFQQAVESYASNKFEAFEEYRREVMELESEADAIKRRIRGHIPVGVRMPVSKFQFFLYLKEQDKVLDSVEESLDWLSFRPKTALPEEIQKDIFNLLESVIEPIEDMSRMVAEAKEYFRTYSDKQRNVVKDIIHNLRKMEHEADRIEREIKNHIFNTLENPTEIFHAVRLVEMIGSIADHAENAGDMMRAMIARKKGFFGRSEK